MAIIFELWAECYTEQDTQDFGSHFDGLQHTLITTGRVIYWGVNRHRSWTNGIPMAISVASDELSNYGVRSLTDAIETTEAGLRLYKHLWLSRIKRESQCRGKAAGSCMGLICAEPAALPLQKP